jgi:hypothetical protein
MDIKNIILSKDINANTHFIDRYIHLLSIIIPTDHNEKHNILPRSIFHEFLKVKEIIILVPTRWHY